jgi:flavorubredoxin
MKVQLLNEIESQQEDEMAIKVLVTYASKYGATAEIAERIGQILE